MKCTRGPFFWGHPVLHSKSSIKLKQYEFLFKCRQSHNQSVTSFNNIMAVLSRSARLVTIFDPSLVK